MVDRTCRSCGEAKPDEDFHRGPHGEGRRPDCKPCANAKRRARYATAGGRDISYGQVLRREYGLTLAEYGDMLRRQAHRCAICRRPQHSLVSKGGTETRRLMVDHDHVTGAIRGLLCHRCNQLVWAIEDNHTTLDAIRQYVEQWRESFGSGAPL